MVNSGAAWMVPATTTCQVRFLPKIFAGKCEEACFMLVNLFSFFHANQQQQGLL
jgi:hypothetical protein